MSEASTTVRARTAPSHTVTVPGAAPGGRLRVEGYAGGEHVVARTVVLGPVEGRWDGPPGGPTGPPGGPARALGARGIRVIGPPAGPL